MNLNDLFAKEELDPAQILVLRHRPSEPGFRKVLPWLAAERPTLFNAYQQAHGAKVEKAMLTSASYVASFIGYEPGKAVFVGLYAIRGAKPLTRDEYWAVPANRDLKRRGMKGFGGEDGRTSIQWFDLELLDFYQSWKGKLIVTWPGLERSWWRRAHKNTIPVHAILEESMLDAAMPAWNELTLTWEELAVLPTRWQAALAQSRGIYYIHDTTDGKAYVGAAYGKDNLLGRWQHYASSGHGGNRLLRKRDPKHFVFTILERVSPDMDADDAIRLESTWKTRLHTRTPQGLNEN